MFGICFQIICGVGVGWGTNERRWAVHQWLFGLHGENSGAIILFSLLLHVSEVFHYKKLMIKKTTTMRLREGSGCVSSGKVGKMTRASQVRSIPWEPIHEHVPSSISAEGTRSTGQFSDHFHITRACSSHQSRRSLGTLQRFCLLPRSECERGSHHLGLQAEKTPWVMGGGQECWEEWQMQGHSLRWTAKARSCVHSQP